MVFSKLRCSKVTTLVPCQTYDLQIDAYFSTFRNFCQIAEFQLAGLKNTAIWNNNAKQKKPESIEVSLQDPNGANCKNTAIWNE